MQLRQFGFNAQAVALVDGVCEEAWRQVRKTIFFPTQEDSHEVMRELAQRVMAAVAAGERDPERLKAIALQGLDC